MRIGDKQKCIVQTINDPSHSSGRKCLQELGHLQLYDQGTTVAEYRITIESGQSPHLDDWRAR